MPAAAMMTLQSDGIRGKFKNNSLLHEGSLEMASQFDLRRVVLLVTGVVFSGFGLLCLLYPDLLTRLTGIASPTLTGQIELQAVYGGLQIGFGVLLLACAILPRWSGAGIWVVVALVGGLALGRGAGVAAYGWESIYTSFSLIYESLTSLTALIAAFYNPSLKRKQQPLPVVMPQPVPVPPAAANPTPYSPMP